jgi:hypothetical protein
VSSEDELESRMCPVCCGKMKLARVGGHPKVSTYQCLSCKECHDGRGLDRERFLLPVAHVQAEIKKSFIGKGAASPPPRRSYSATAPLSAIKSFGNSRPLKRRALGIKLLAFGNVRWEFYRL